MIDLKKVTHKDLEKILEIENINFPAENQASYETIESRFNIYPGLTLLQEDEKPIGYISYGLLKSSYIEGFSNKPELLIPDTELLHKNEVDELDYFAIISIAINRESRSKTINLEEKQLSYCRLLIAHALTEGRDIGLRKTSVLCESHKTISLFSKLDFKSKYNSTLQGLPLVLFVNSFDNLKIQNLIRTFEKLSIGP